ncbi:hypothetical protein [Desertivirga arenae]|uniref:hypothetical protein n=1 Tax=Desertivirga arenae TaxID=2810309 RepID=UPI001A964964|nr:hypothetical protein [Pedobacter sp. SYSU D00823]
MQTILIPTSFQLKSCECVSAIIKQFKGQDISILFTHMFKLSDSISDLLMLSRRVKEYEYVPEEFYRECHELKLNSPELKSIGIEFFYGGTLAAFKNFLETHQINYILNPDSCDYAPLNKSSIDPAVLINRASLPILELKKLSPQKNYSAKEELEEVN